VKFAPVTVRVASELPASTVEGEIEVRMGAGLTMVTEAEAVRVGSTTLAAFTVTTFGEGGIAGAAYKPLASMIPTVALPPATPFTDQLTPWFALPVTVAVNGCVCVTFRVGVVGLTATTISTVRFTAFEVPPPGLGVTTVTAKVPALASCAAGITAINCVALPKLVVSALPPSFTVDCCAKPVPVTVSVVSGLPALTVEGEMEPRVGAGLTTVTEAEAVRVGSATLAAFTVTTLGTGGTAGAVYRPLELMLPTVAFPPAMSFTDQVTPGFVLPVTVAVNGCVCVTWSVCVEGLTATNTRTVRFTASEVPPPGLGVTTVTGKVPALVNCAAGITAVSWVELTKLVASEVPLSSTIDCGVKSVPVTVRVVSGLPASTAVGDIELRLGAGLTMVTDAVPVRVGSTTLVAFTVTTFGEGGIAGAVYRPLASIVPSVALPPATSFTDQVTPWFALPVTVAVNGCVCVTWSVCVEGLTVTTTTTVRFVAFEVPPPGLGVTTVTGKVPALVN
jgi:hypothetical protein